LKDHIMPTIDEVLRDQSRLHLSFNGTLEVIPDDTEHLRCTPHVRGGGCACQHALKLRKQDIEEVKPTGATVPCCGKQLDLFRIYLRESAQIPAVDFVRHVVNAARSPTGPITPHPSRCAQRCNDDFQGCMESARDDSDRWSCSNALGWCISDCASPRGSLRTVAAHSECDCEGLYSALSDLQLQLEGATPGEKSALVRRIRRLWSRIDACGC
jgi:hypothetical protein